jgi:6-phosphogluconolactonase (cycloisomerase 2 family)
MHVSRPLAAALGTGILVAGLGPLAGGLAGASTGGRHALFVETDNTTANQILAYHRGSDGSLSLAGTYDTGGTGGTAVGATADPLASQGGLALADQGSELLAVNAGSDTVSVFEVSGTSLHRTQVISSGGEFPASIAVDGSKVAVLNSGGAGAVAEFRLRGGRLVARPNEVRSLGLSNTNPPGYVAGPGQVGFSPDGTHLIVADKHSTDAFQVFSVSAGGALGASAVQTSSQVPVPFAFTFDAAGHLVDVEAGASALSTYTLNQDGTLTPIGTVGDGGTALCWLATSNGYYYGSNAGSGTVSSFTVSSSGVPALDQATAAVTHAGTTDEAVSPDGKVLYVESGGAGALDAFSIGADGTLSPIQTTWNLPVASEGIVAT